MRRKQRVSSERIGVAS
jgi:hypothetical protein